MEKRRAPPDVVLLDVEMPDISGYEVGADDYLVKPFEPENLIARISVMQRLSNQRVELMSRYQAAQETAMLALTGTGELGMAMQFLERSHTLGSTADPAEALFEVTRRLELNCCLYVCTDDGEDWFVNGEGIRPLQKELVTISDRTQRFVDFGAHTIINYQHLSLLYATCRCTTCSATAAPGT